MRRLRLLSLAVLALGLLGGWLLRAEEPLDLREHLHEVAPGESFTWHKSPYGHFRSEEGTVVFNTHQVAPQVRGWAGPIETLVALSPQGKITGIKILRHRETPNYVRGMLRREFLKQFLGKDINDPLQVGLDIDGVSRATVSVQALAEGVRVASRRMAGEVLGLEVRAGEEARALAWLRLSALAGLFLYALAGFWLLRRHPRWQRLRDASLLLGLLVLGLWQASPMSVLHVLNLLLLRVSAEPLLWVLLLGVALTVLVSAGRLYCGWLCPFGAVAEFVARLLPGRAWPIERTEEERLRRLKYPLLWLAALAVLLTGRTEFALYEVYVGLFSFSANPALWALVALSVLLNPWAWRLWCRWLCPVGAALALLSRNDPDRYPSSPLCPMGNAPRPEGAECIRCMRCYTPKRPMISRSNEG